jgi:hypothetical protein
MSLVEQYHREHLERKARLYGPTPAPRLAAPPEPPKAPEPVVVVKKDNFRPQSVVWPTAGWIERPEDSDEPVVGPLTIRTIQITVCKRYGVGLLDLNSIRRTANLVRPRQVAMYLAKKHTLRSLPFIGRRFGGRDHTTVLHAVRKIEWLIADEPELAAEVKAIEQMLGVAS